MQQSLQKSIHSSAKRAQIADRRERWRLKLEGVAIRLAPRRPLSIVGAFSTIGLWSYVKVS